jgi:hypothetical protein
MACLLSPAIALCDSPPLPQSLSGSAFWTRGSKQFTMPLALAELRAEGSSVTGTLSNYRSPMGNCLSDNTPLTGTYADGVLNVKSAPLKSQFADGTGCGPVRIEAKVGSERTSGTMKVGNETAAIELTGK